MFINYSNLKVVVIYDIVNEINKDKLIEFIVGLQQPDGSKLFFKSFYFVVIFF
jgi:prenyltransferase beta subunit